MLGQTVTFTSRNPTDPTVYKGIIAAPEITYALSGSFGFDSVSYNAAVQRAVPAVGDITTLSYFVITLTNGQTPPATRLFANDWIAPGSFSVIQQATVYNVNIYDLPAKGQAAILALLQAAGYNAVPVTTPSAAALSQGSTTNPTG
jgi:hypothetical protein